MSLPSNVTYCTVTGTFVQAVADGVDSDHNPDASAVAGVSITFTPSVSILRDATSPGTIIIPKAVVVSTNASGQIIDSQGNLGVVLVATDDPGLTPVNWTWNVSCIIGNIPISFDIAAPGGTSVDLANVIPIPTSPGVVITAGTPGADGAPGPANVLSIGTVSGGSTASATITGTSPAQVLNLVLPKGTDGTNGTNGTNGVPGALCYVWDGAEYRDATGALPSTTVPTGIGLRLFDWGDYTSAPTTVTPVSGVRDLYIQSRDMAQAMLLAGGGSTGGGTTTTGSFPGIVQIDSFSGTTDTAKLTAALAWLQTQTHMPWLQLPDRVFDTGASTFSVFTGLKIIGPGFPYGEQNLEVSSGVGVTAYWKTSCGSGASSLLQATTTVYDVIFAGIAFYGSSSSSQIFRSTVNMYACAFNNLTFYNCKNAIGNPTEKFLCTQVLFDGHFTCLSFGDTQFCIGGGDCQFKWFLNADSPTTVAGAGRPIVIFDAFSKVDHSGYMYLTGENDWAGLQIKGSDSCRVNIFGGTFEGRSQTSLATRSMIDIQGGHVVMYGPHIGQISDTASALGAISQEGGTLEIYSPEYWRGSAVAASFPMLYQTGGTAHVYHPKTGVAGEQVRLRWSDGTTVTVPLPSNGYTA